MNRDMLMPAFLAILLASGCGSTIKATGDVGEDAQPDLVDDVTGDVPVDAEPDGVPDVMDDHGPDGGPPDAVPDPGPDASTGGLVGDPCVDETELTDCSGIPSGERFCLNYIDMGPAGRLEFPDGYCSAPCNNPGDCGEGGLCIPLGPGGAYCFRECTSTEDCRESYVCDHFPGPYPTPDDYCLPPMG
jgi:hypothetical protein